MTLHFTIYIDNPTCTVKSNIAYNQLSYVQDFYLLLYILSTVKTMRM
jgi:hypothetical protein